MELRYIVLTIIKILLSVPAIVLIIDNHAEAAALIKENSKRNNTPGVFNSHSYAASIIDNLDVNNNITNEEADRSKHNSSHDYDKIRVISHEYEKSEEIPNPSPLVVPGYNLPETIFNKGKPFYLEKDPVTGTVNFSSKTGSSNEDYDYYEDEVNPEIYDKSSIDRKDGELYGHHKGHRPSDINQLTPNIHDFLNLPVKYNPDKHVYPLISSSYANTKIQGNINKHYNHKDENISYSSYKSTSSPSYSSKTQYSKYNVNNLVKTTEKSTTTITTTTTTTTPRPSIKSTRPAPSTTTSSYNLMNSFMNHPSYGATQLQITNKPRPNDIYLTTNNMNNIHLTTRTPVQFTTTTKRTLSLFEQLFGNFDDIELTERPTSSKAPSTTVPPYTTKTNSPIIVNATNHKEIENAPSVIDPEPEYEYEDYYSSENDNVAVESNPSKMELKVNHTKHSNTEENQHPSQPLTTTKSVNYFSTTTSHKPSKFSIHSSPQSTSQLYSTSTTPFVTKTTEKVTSLPLGDNHFGSYYNPPAVVSLSHDIRDNLNKEKVPYIQTYDNTVLKPVPSSNNIRIAPHQDTVSFVVGNHQNVQGDSSYSADHNKNDGNIPGEFYSDHSYTKGGIYDVGHLQPHFSSEANQDVVHYTVQTKIEHGEPSAIGGNKQKVEGSVSTVNLQPIQTSEASVAIGIPLDSVKKIPGQVVDEKLDNENIKFPKKGSGAKIVFPKEDQYTTSSKKPLVPKQPTKQPPINREVLSLNSKPIFHQLPSDLTPPSETEISPSRLDRPRPPWDPRPGHFYNGRPEYSRPPKPYSKYEPYKRIDSLPNILPQFRPNMKVNSGPHFMDHKKILRPPMIDRQPNRAPNYYEKLVPPAPPKHLQSLRKLPPPPLFETETSESNFLFYNQHQKSPQAITINPINLSPKPPQTKIANRRQSESDEIETLQMIQAKNTEIKEQNTVTTHKETTQNPLYVVYPVNSTPAKLQNSDKGKKETVIVGTRAELPLPPSEIHEDFPFDKLSNRDDDPILKPQTKPASYNVKTNFPYRLEKPEFSSSSTSTENNFNNLQSIEGILSNNQWNTLDDSESKLHSKNPNEISSNLHIYTEKPIAVAYTPTESHHKIDSTKQEIGEINNSKYSMPNYGGSVISEIRDEPFPKFQIELDNKYLTSKKKYFENHKIQEETTSVKDEPPKLDFQAPFQASINLDSVSQGWTVVRNKEKSEIDRSDDEITTTSVDTTSEFDIENFKPQLFGGFKPLYSQPDEAGGNITDRQER
ncbi:uncharacterized protein LOC108742024 [Agrilus planipennis]|uniref:Uncharacterized protein LOC108742024 n=1 Tax=Agrilus planipennis TaxID=224129 RepID=A0A1W4XIB7_AGRPL|nr:uncharacterized protein LOC108742024 [Agrilus planipennis]